MSARWSSGFVIVGMVVALTGAEVRAQQGSRKPNVLVLCVDDLNNHLGCYGQDPHEFRNLAADPGHADVLKEMQKRLQKARTGR